MIGICCSIASRSQRLSGGIRVRTHEGIFDNFVAVVDLPVGLALIVIPHASTLPGKDSSDREQRRHLSRFENAALRVDERDTLALKVEPPSEIIGTQDAAVQGGDALNVLERRLAQLNIVCGEVHSGDQR
jgi:hypothetical protein